MESARRKQAAGGEDESPEQQRQGARDDSGSPVDAVPSPSNNGAPVVSPAGEEPVGTDSAGTAANSSVMSSGVGSPVEKQDTEQTKEEEEQEEEELSSRQPPLQHPQSQQQQSPEDPPPQPPRPPSPTPLAQNLEEEVLEGLRRTEHPPETVDSDEENVGSVSDEEHHNEKQREQDLESRLRADNRSETSPSRAQKASLAERDELLLNLEEGLSAISDIFEEAAGSPLSFRLGSRLFGTAKVAAPYSPKYLSASQKPKFSSKAYRSRVSGTVPSASPRTTPRDYCPQPPTAMSSFVVSTSVGYYLDEVETKVSVDLLCVCVDGDFLAEWKCGGGGVCVLLLWWWWW